MKFTFIILNLLFFINNLSAVETEKGKPKEPLKKDTVAVIPPAPKKEDTPFKTIAETTKKCKKIDGLFPIYQDTITGKTFVEINEQKLGKEFIYFKQILDGVPNTGFFRGAYRDNKIIKIQKYFDKIEFYIQNTAYYFDPKNAISKAENANINNPLVLSLPISAFSVDTGSIKTKRYLVEGEKIFLQENFSQLKPSGRLGETPYNTFNLGSLSADRTKYLSINNYEKNTDVYSEFVFENKYPTFAGGDEITDPRAVSVKIQQSFVEIPSNDFIPRFEDPRVGYFTEQITDLTSTNAMPYRDVINKWNLVKKDSSAALSEPITPIVWWIENTTPIELRPTIKLAVERWNLAFEKAGFLNAIVCNIQPDSAKWDAGDIRYNVIRWTASPTPPFGGYGPSFANPRTGQILGADIMLEYVYLTNRIRQSELFDIVGLENSTESHFDNEHHCSAGELLQFNSLFAQSVMEAYDFSNFEKDEYLKQTLIGLVLHEVGHTFGLNHNFAASLWNTFDQMQDKNRGETLGLSASVMDYMPSNISSDKTKQGLYYDVIPGPYDVWAIQYGYTTFENSEKEKIGLAEITAKSTQSENLFYNDADDMRSPGKGIDPRAMLFDHSADPLSYATMQIKMSDSVIKKIQEKFIKDGSSYNNLRNAFLILTAQQSRSLGVISRYIGGINIDRSFPEQKSKNLPFTPVSYKDQKRAMQLLSQFAFSKNSFETPSNLANYLQMQRRGFTSSQSVQNPQLLSRTLNIQKSILDQLLNPLVINRIMDAELYGNTYKITEVFNDYFDAIFKEDLNSIVSTKRQNLQIEYTNRLISILTNDTQIYDAGKSIILLELNKILKANKASLASDISTKAHRENIVFLITKFLEK